MQTTIWKILLQFPIHFLHNLKLQCFCLPIWNSTQWNTHDHHYGTPNGPCSLNDWNESQEHHISDAPSPFLGKVMWGISLCRGSYYIHFIQFWWWYITSGIIYFMDLVHHLTQNHEYQGQVQYLLSDCEYSQNLLGDWVRCLLGTGE